MSALLRLSGRAALAAGLIHLFQFLVLGVGPALSNESEFPSPTETSANYWFGLAGLTTFTLVGLADLVFFSAATALVWQSTAATGVAWRRAAQTAATVGIACWFLAGATQLAVRGFNATALADLGASDEVQRAVLQGAYLPMTMATVAGAVVFGAWWIGFAVQGLRTRTFGMPTAIAALLFGAFVPLAGWLTNVGAFPSVVIAFLVVGPVLLRRARRVEDEGGEADAGAPASIPTAASDLAQ